MARAAVFNTRRGRQSLRTYSLLGLTSLLVGLPLVWFLLTSLKKESEYLAYPIQFLPHTPQWINYVDALTRFPFFKYAGHSLYLSGTNTLLTVISSAMAGFAFSRYANVPGRRFLFSIVIVMMVVPKFVLLMPNFLVFSQLHLTNTYWPWILWGISGDALHVFLFRQFFASIPRDLEDAAEVDGAGPFRIFWQIFLPNSLPVLSASVVLQFSAMWGDYITPIMFLSASKTTLAVQLATAYVNPKGIPLITITMAAAVLFSLPLVALFFLGQKHILQGVVTSGLKG